MKLVAAPLKVCAVLVVAVAGAWLAPEALAQEITAPPSDVLLDEIGPGWAPGDACGALLSSSDSPAVCFERDDDTLVIYDLAMAPGVNGGDALALATGPFSGAPVLPTPGLRATAGFVVTEEPGVTALAVVTASTGHIFKLIFTSTRPAATVAPFIVDVAQRQQQRAGGPPAASQGGIDRARDEELDRLFITFPPDSGIVLLQTATIPQSFDDLRGMARSQRVVDLLNGSPVRHRIFGIGAGRFLIVTLGQQPFDEFAATELGGYRNTTQIVDRRHVVGLEDAVGYRFRDGDQYGVAFRRGPYVANISVAGPDIQAAAAMRLVDEVARQQAVLLPPGGTAPYFFPSTARSVALAVGCTTGTCLIAFGLARFAARRRRRPSSAPRASSLPPSAFLGDVVDVSEAASGLRRRGVVLLTGQLIAINLLVVGVLGLLGALELPTWAAMGLVILGLAWGVGFTSWCARAELRAHGGRGRPARGLWRSPLSLVAAMCAVAALVIGTALAATGLAGFVFGPSLSGLERAKALGTDPDLLNMGAALAGIVLLVGGALLVRLARMWSRSSAARLRARDRRAPILYLRSFDDDALPLAAVVTARRPFLELFLPRGSDPFEESLVWELAPHGPVVAIGRPGRSLSTLGAARDHLPDDEWQRGVMERMSDAQAVAIVLGSTEGVRWEIGQVVATGNLAKTIFVLPPTDPVTIVERWQFTAGALASAGAVIPPLPVEPPQVLTAYLDGRHQWHVTVSPLRDEASYRAAVDQSMAWLLDQQRSDEPVTRLTSAVVSA